MIETIAGAKQRFVMVFVSVLVITYGFLVAIDFVPEPPAAEAESVATTGQDDVVATASDVVAHTAQTEVATGSEAARQLGEEVEPLATPTISQQAISSREALPVRITIDRLDRTVPVLNPTSRRVADLDAALLGGVVRHPDAADLVRDGNILILGHSSRLPNVVNRNFQAFNDIERLQWGDTIRVFSATHEHIYRVDRVYEARASEVVVPIADTGPRLTLVTCNNFGAIEDRFIVEAEWLSARALYLNSNLKRNT